MKKLTTLFIFFTTILLTSCGTSTTSTDVTTTYNGQGFAMTVPKAWTQVKTEELPNIKSGKVELALTSTEISAGFANNLTILGEDIMTKISSVEYSNTNYIRTTGSVLEYVKLDEKTFSFKDNDEGKIYIFEAKYNTSTPKRKFLQTAKICKNKAHLITIGISIDVTNTAKYEDLLKSFECK